MSRASFDISRRGLLAAAGGSAALALPGCRRLGRQDGSTLVIALDPEPLALASAGSIDAGASVISPKLFDRLFITDLHGEQVPMLAESASVEDGGKRVTIRLRPNLLWHDGQPITGEDVAYSIHEVWKFNARAKLAFTELAGVDTPDPRTVVLRYKQPTPFVFSALADGGTQVVPRHIYAGKGDIRSNPANLKPVGSGPWVFENWEKGNYLSLRRNPRYWNPQQPRLDRLVFRLIAGGAPTVAALESGDVDYAPIPLTDAARLKDNPKLWVRPIGAEVSTSFAGFAFNLNKPVFRDPRVRHAFAHAIDRDFILKNIYLGYGVLADSPIAPNSPWHAGGLPVYEYDPARAEQLLDAAGFPRGKDGVRLRLFNDIMPPSTLNPRTAQFIRQSLSRIGIELQLRQEGLPAYLKRIFTTRDWDTETYGTGSEIDPAIGIQRFYSSGSINIGVPYSNPTHYSTPETDRLFDQAAAETDRARRKALYDRIQHLIQTDLPLIPILFPSTVEAGSKRFDIPLTTRIRNLADARLVKE
jgi:peptide/nickel transport system substrate-binding protein